MKKYQYFVINRRRASESIIMEMLNEMGDQGWRLIEVVNYDMNARQYIFEREII